MLFVKYSIKIIYKKIDDNVWHCIVVNMMAFGPKDPGTIPRLAKVYNDVIFFHGVFMIQFNLI